MSATSALATPTAMGASARRQFNIAVFSYGLPFPGYKRSGIEQVAHDLANAFIARGHEVTVFTYDPAPPDATYRTLPLPGGQFARSRLGRALFQGYLGNVIALSVDYCPFDVIVAHGDSLLLPLTGKPIIRVMHGSALEELRSARSVSRVVLQAGVYVQELLTALMQRGTVAVSHNTRRFNPFIRHVIPNGIDLTRFTPRPEAASSAPSILFVGALHGRKRGAWLLERFASVIRPAVPDAELHMVTAPGAPAPGVTYHTGVSREVLLELYQSCWVYASPSTYEGFGLPYVEALACGLPVVATANPGSLEVLESGRFGRITPDDQFAPTVCELLGNADERRRLSRAGLSRASMYDIRQAATSYERLIETMVPCHA